MRNTETNYQQYPNCRIGTGVSLGDFCVLGKPSRVRHPASVLGQDPRQPVVGSEMVIGDGCYVGAHVIIEEGVRIGDLTVVDSNATIESDVRIGTACYIVHGARICEAAKIGDRCVIGGFVADNSVVGDASRVFGMLVHRHENPHLGWDEVREDAPRLGKDVIVGTGAQVIGGIAISDHVYVCSGAIVTKDVPSGHVVFGHNEIIPFGRWKGRLRNSPYWSTRHDAAH